MPDSIYHHPSSYRDPSGYIFIQNNTLYRQVNNVFREHFDFFISSGCYQKLVQKGLLIPHENVDENLTGDKEWYTTLKPERVDFISYPYEWSFDMLKDAALLTLNLVKEALLSGMIVKDATPYNIQWHNGQLVFIDTLSFEKYDETKPWIAYRQFCENFLSPLLLTHYAGRPLQEMMLAYSDGIPLLVTQSLLSWRTKFSIHTYLHIHLHAKYSVKQPAQQTGKKSSFSKQKLLNLLASLEKLINQLKLPESKSTWSDYYDEAYQRPDYLQNKEHIIQQWLEKIKPISTAADLGANTGEFSKLTAANNIKTIAADFDALCINALYNKIKKSGEKNILPIILDLSKPSPAIGVNNEERDSFIKRTNADLILALALIHHLAIGKNIPMDKIARFFHRMCEHLIIEFVPKEDEKVQYMLQQREDIFPGYNEPAFVSVFANYFSVVEKQAISGTSRTLYLMKRL